MGSGDERYRRSIAGRAAFSSAPRERRQAREVQAEISVENQRISSPPRQPGGGTRRRIPCPWSRLRRSLPKVPYLTLTDGIFLTCYSFAFLTAIEVTAVHWAERSGRVILSRRIRRRTKALLPITFVVVTLAMLVRYLHE